nr:K809 [uncultured bacterium]
MRLGFFCQHKTETKSSRIYKAQNHNFFLADISEQTKTSTSGDQAY